MGEIVSERTDQNYIADWTHVLSDSFVLDLRLSFGRFTSKFPDGQRSYGFTADQLGMKIPHAPTVSRNTAPRINMSDYNGVIGNTYSWSTDNHWDFAPSLTHTRGRHTLHVGFEYAYIGRGTGGPGRVNGEFTFDRFWTQQYSTRGQGSKDGSGVASLLLGFRAVGSSITTTCITAPGPTMQATFRTIGRPRRN